jgi:hypothetical protein
MCGGASSAQVGLQDSQIAFYNQMTAEQSAEFAQSQSILKGLTSIFDPIAQAGPSQLGYSAAELQDLNSLATTGVGTNYAAAQRALAVQRGSESGGNSFVPSGANREMSAQLAQSAAQQESSESLGIQQADWQQGLQNWQTAISGEEGVAGLENPAGYANAATGAGSAASTTANEVTNANNSWMQLVSGAIGGLAQGAGAVATGGATSAIKGAQASASFGG